MGGGLFFDERRLMRAPDAKALPTSFLRKGSHDRIRVKARDLQSLGNTVILVLDSDRKMLSVPPDYKSNCPCLFEGCLVHKAHIKCTSTLRPCYNIKAKTMILGPELQIIECTSTSRPKTSITEFVLIL